MSSSTVFPHTFVALRLPSGTHKVLKIIPDTVVSLGKYGSFHSNLLLGRPFYLTFEILDHDNEQASSELRIVPASELHADNIAEEAREETAKEDATDDGFEIDRANGEIIIRNNMLTVDDPSRQTLTMADIEALKKETTGSGKDIISKIMQSHSALDEKTAFSLAKYALRKSKKYMRRFTLLPLDVSMLARWILDEKEPARIMEVREETIGLITSWSNVHCTRDNPIQLTPHGRWLVVDDTGGLMVAALAERMDILYPREEEEEDETEEQEPVDAGTQMSHNDVISDTVKSNTDVNQDKNQPETSSDPKPGGVRRRKQRRHPPDAMSATSNTITLLHAASQPNISMLSYFSYNPNDTSALEPYRSSKHQLHTHLKTISWLQLLTPELDTAYAEPEAVSEEILGTWKTSKRGNYFRKRRRWECTKRVVEEARGGGFDGLVVASAMDVVTIFHRVVPLLRGGAQVVVYSPNVEPLTDLLDVYSSHRKTAFLNLQRDGKASELVIPSEDFPLDPRLLLAPSLQTARAKEWQVLPGRTHPLMTGRGGPEGYLFTATRVLPVEGNVEARGKFTKKRKVADDSTIEVGAASAANTPEVSSLDQSNA